MDRKAKNAMAWKHHRREAGVTKSGVLSDLGGCSIFALGKTNKQTNTFPDQWVSSEISLVPLILLLIKHLVCATFTTAKIMRKVPAAVGTNQNSQTDKAYEVLSFFFSHVCSFGLYQTPESLPTNAFTYLNICSRSGSQSKHCTYSLHSASLYT